MQIIWAFLPLVAFVATAKLAGIYAATAVLIGVALIQLVVHRWRDGRFKPMPVVVAVLAVVLGGATLVLHDQRYIQWKATALFWILALAFLVSRFLGSRTLVERIFSSTAEIVFRLDPRQWRTLNWAWVAFYAALGALNLYVAQHYSVDTWLNFKAYGLTGLNILFILPQAFWLASRTETAEKPPGETP